VKQLDVIRCPRHSLGVEENLTLLSAHLNSQSDHGDGQEISTDSSCLSYGGGGENGFRDRFAIKDGSLSKA